MQRSLGQQDIPWTLKCRVNGHNERLGHAKSVAPQYAFLSHTKKAVQHASGCTARQRATEGADIPTHSRQQKAVAELPQQSAGCQLELPVPPTFNCLSHLGTLDCQGVRAKQPSAVLTPEQHFDADCVRKSACFSAPSWTPVLRQGHLCSKGIKRSHCLGRSCMYGFGNRGDSAARE